MKRSIRAETKGTTNRNKMAGAKAKRAHMQYALRTRFAREIVCEFMPPAKRQSAAQQDKAIIFCGGMPGYPGNKIALMNFLSRKGYWTFIPRYRGTWESGGTFLARSPERDVLDVIDGIRARGGFKDAFAGKTYRIARPAAMKTYVIGSSFGGAAAILASRDPRVRRAVAFSPVTDWRTETEIEPLERLASFTRDAFGNGYRVAPGAWEKLRSGTLYNPIREAASIDGTKLLIIHAKDDTVVYARTSAAFARATGARLILLPRGGHLSVSQTAEPRYWKIIKAFLR